MSWHFNIYERNNSDKKTQAVNKSIQYKVIYGIQIELHMHFSLISHFWVNVAEFC